MNSWNCAQHSACECARAAKRGKEKPLEQVSEPKKCEVPPCSKVGCGADFTMWLCEGGRLFAAGNPQHGQLGDGSDHSVNVKDSSIEIKHEPQARALARRPEALGQSWQVDRSRGSGSGPLCDRLRPLRMQQATPGPECAQGIPMRVAHIGAPVVNVACGVNHTVCVTAEGECFTWGSGNYGRLGHKVQQDEFLPRKVETLTGRLAVPDRALVAAGGNATFCDATTAKFLYAWGKLKISGDGQMYPAAFQDMMGWNVRSMACGPATYAIAAETSAVTWGAAHNTELAYGRNGKKSSANPAKVMALEGMHTHQARACAHMLLCAIKRLAIA